MNRRQVLAVLFGLGIIGIMIGLDWWLFHFMSTNYFLWYLENGTLIGIAVSFLAVVWEGLESRKDLLSAHPLRYLRGCTILLATLFHSISIYLESPEGPGGKRLRQPASFYWDLILTTVVLMVVMVLGLAWLVVMAPLNYFVTIISGAVARQSFRGTPRRAIVIQIGKKVILTAQPANEEIPPSATDVSFAVKPFAVTQAVTSLVLLIAKMIYGATT